MSTIKKINANGVLYDIEDTEARSHASSVTSVNGKTGTVNLTASDVGALPNNEIFIKTFKGRTPDLNNNITPAIGDYSASMISYGNNSNVDDALKSKIPVPINDITLGRVPVFSHDTTTPTIYSSPIMTRIDVGGACTSSDFLSNHIGYKDGKELGKLKSECRYASYGEHKEYINGKYKTVSYHLICNLSFVWSIYEENGVTLPTEIEKLASVTEPGYSRQVYSSECASFRIYSRNYEIPINILFYDENIWIRALDPSNCVLRQYDGIAFNVMYFTNDTTDV